MKKEKTLPKLFLFYWKHTQSQKSSFMRGLPGAPCLTEMVSGQTPSLNLTSRTCSKNHINWYKRCRVLHRRALNVDEDGERGRAAGRGDVMHRMMRFRCIHFITSGSRSICLSQIDAVLHVVAVVLNYPTTCNTCRNNTDSASQLREKSGLQ